MTSRNTRTTPLHPTDPQPSPRYPAVERRPSPTNSSTSTVSSSSTYAPYQTAPSASSSPDPRQRAVGRVNGLRETDVGARGGEKWTRSMNAGPSDSRNTSKRNSRMLSSAELESKQSFERPHLRQDPISPRYTLNPTAHPTTPTSSAGSKRSIANQTTPKRVSLTDQHPAIPSPTTSSSHYSQSTSNHTSLPYITTQSEHQYLAPHTPSSNSSHSTAGSSSTARGFSTLTASGRNGKAPEPLDLSPVSAALRAERGREREKIEAARRDREGYLVEPNGYLNGPAKEIGTGRSVDERFSDPVEKSATPRSRSHFSPGAPLGVSTEPMSAAMTPASSSGGEGRRASWFAHSGEVNGSPSRGRSSGERVASSSRTAGQGEGDETYSPYASLGRRVLTDPLHEREPRDSPTASSTARSSVASRYNLFLPAKNPTVPLSAMFSPPEKRSGYAAVPSPSAFIDAENDVDSVWMEQQGQGQDVPRYPVPQDTGSGTTPPRVSLYEGGEGRRLPKSARLRETAQDAEIKPLPRQPSLYNLQTPQHRSTHHFASPSTPGPTDPRDLDRAGLMGLGELATPRWTTAHPISPLGPPRTGNGDMVKSHSAFALSRRAQSISNSESYDSLAIFGQSPPMPSLTVRNPPTRKISGPRIRIPSNTAVNGSSRLAPPLPVAGVERDVGARVGLGVNMDGDRSDSAGLPDIPRVSPLDFSLEPMKKETIPSATSARSMDQDPSSPARKAMPTSYGHSKRYSPQIAAGLEALREREQIAAIRASQSAQEGMTSPQSDDMQSPARVLPTSYSSPLLEGPGRQRVRSTDSDARERHISNGSASLGSGLGKRELRASSSSQRNLAILATLIPPELPTAHSIIKQYGSTRDFSHLPPSPSTASINQFMMREAGSKGSLTPAEDLPANSPASIGSPAFPFPAAPDTAAGSASDQRRRSQGTSSRTPRRSLSKQSIQPTEDDAVREAALRKLDGLGKQSMSSLRSRERLTSQGDPDDTLAKAMHPEESVPQNRSEKGERRRSEGTSSGSKRDFTPSTSPGTSWHSRAFSNVSTAPSSADLNNTGRASMAAKASGSSQDGSDTESHPDHGRIARHVPPVPALPKDVHSLGRRPMQKSQTMSDLSKAGVDGQVHGDFALPAVTVPSGPSLDSYPMLSLSPPDPGSTVSPSMSGLDFPKSPSTGSVSSGSRRMSKKWSFSSALNRGFSRGKADPMVLSPGDSVTSPEQSPGIAIEGFGGLPKTYMEFGLKVPTSNARKNSFASSAGSEELHPVRETSETEARSDGNEPGPSRRTPSGIPFFRRSSSTSNTGQDSLSSKASSSTLQKDSVPIGEVNTGARSKKVLGIGIPSMLQKGSNTTRKDSSSLANVRDAAEPGGGDGGWPLRRRGKTLNAAETAACKPAPPLPPIQIKDLPLTTVERVSSLRKAGFGSSLLPVAADSSLRRMEPSAAPLTRSATQNFPRTSDLLPSIKASPSMVGSRLKTTPSPSAVGISRLPSTTPTRIPRISSKVSMASAYPALTDPSTTNKIASMTPPARGAGAQGQAPAIQDRISSHAPTITRQPMANAENEAGRGQPAVQSGSERNRLTSASRAPASVNELSSLDMPRTEDRNANEMLRQTTVDPIARYGPSAGTAVSEVQQTLPTAPMVKSNSIGYAKPLPPSLRPPQAPLLVSRLPLAGTPQRRADFGSPPLAVLQGQPAPSQRMVGSSSSSTLVQQQPSGTSLRSSQSPRSASPITSLVDEDEQRGDLEMADFLRRQKARKASGNWKSGDIDHFLDFPEPGEPAPARSPHEFIKHNFDCLSIYERTEIQEYPMMWFAGDKRKKNPATVDVVHNNYGYDDERGDYLIIDGDHLAYRYEVQGILGKGSFGQVAQCLDHKTGQWMAVKIIRNKKRFHQQALTEIQLLENLLKWDPADRHNMIKMTENFYFRGHLCIVTELLSLNLYELIKANGFIGFSSRLLRRFTVQLLSSMQVMRANRVIHCDLKPENILLRHPAKSGLKVIDFGSSCFEHEKVYTYIQSRFYRSPEIILGTSYHMAIDMWSLGCILAEMYTGFPIFPGENEQEQLTCIMEIMGPPDRLLVERSTRRKLFFEPDGTPKSYVNSKGKRRRPASKTLSQVLKSDDELFVDFIAKCLVWDPDRRLKPATALHHPWIVEGRKRVPNSAEGVASPSAQVRTSRTPGSSLSLKASPISSTAQRHRSLYQETPKPRISEPSPLTARRAMGHGTYATGSLSQVPAATARQYRGGHHQSMRSHGELARAAL